ncbi:Putative membrane-bound ClpP-class protease [Pyrodictium delaneyi]|nr:nodulation protein NfeD [Pyrodictium delaneyi]ALL00718.1 Putative membrane-bound ClpP-class protease [Pyrodictium delaneyi]
MKVARRLASYAPFLALLALLLVMLVASPVAAEQKSLVIVIKVKGVIDGATRDYVERSLDYAEKVGADALVIELDTPGGSLEAALDIATMIENSHIPVIGFVTGKWAVSAGTMILMCSHYAVMEPGTIIGAVQPVALGPSGEYTPINESKVLNPVYKKIEACMKLHNRNATVARLFVYQNLVLDAQEAQQMHVVEAIAHNVWEVLTESNGTIVNTGAGPVRLLFLDPEIEYYDMPPGLLLAHILSDPLVSSIISSIAMLTILAALASGHPVLIVVGIALMLLGLFGLGLSASLVSVVLFVAGLVLLIIELAAIPGFGVVGFTGIALMLIGLFVMFTGKPVYLVSESLQTAFYILLAVLLPLAGLMAVVVYKAVQVWHREPVYKPSMTGKKGHSLDYIPPGKDGFVMVEGEYWRARNVGDKPLSRGDSVLVIGKEGSILLVKPLEDSSDTTSTTTR